MGKGNCYTNPKVPKPTALCDYRPISVTPILFRIVEKIIVKYYIRPVLPADSVRDQFAFRPTGSTTCSLIFFTHHITNA